MYNFEKFIFELNDRYHEMGILANDQYISQIDFLSTFFIYIILVYLIFEYVIFNKKYTALIDKLTIPVGIFMALAFFILSEAYIAIPILAIVYMVMHKIMTDDKYINIREKFDKFF